MKTVIQGGDAIKTYARRDGATAVLKKLGIQPADYPMFLFQTTDGRTAVTVQKAEEYLAAKLRKVANEIVPQAKNLGRTQKEADSNKVKRPSVASVIRAMILAGDDNKAIHEAMKRDFGHDEDKAHYPAWYRSQMRREGLVPPAEKKAPPKDRQIKRTNPKKRGERTGLNKPKAATKTKHRRQKTRVIKTEPTLAQRNIKATLSASIKTGHTSEPVAPHSHIQVK